MMVRMRVSYDSEIFDLPALLQSTASTGQRPRSGALQRPLQVSLATLNDDDSQRAPLSWTQWNPCSLAVKQRDAVAVKQRLAIHYPLRPKHAIDVRLFQRTFLDWIRFSLDELEFSLSAILWIHKEIGKIHLSSSSHSWIRNLIEITVVFDNCTGKLLVCFRDKQFWLGHSNANTTIWDDSVMWGLVSTSECKYWAPDYGGW